MIKLKPSYRQSRLEATDIPSFPTEMKCTSFLLTSPSGAILMEPSFSPFFPSGWTECWLLVLPDSFDVICPFSIWNSVSAKGERALFIRATFNYCKQIPDPWYLILVPLSTNTLKVSWVNSEFKDVYSLLSGPFKALLEWAGAPGCSYSSGSQNCDGKQWGEALAHIFLSLPLIHTANFDSLAPFPFCQLLQSGRNFLCLSDWPCHSVFSLPQLCKLVVVVRSLLFWQESASWN